MYYKKERLKVRDMRYKTQTTSIATVSDELLDTYKQITGDTATPLEIVKRVIREQILFRDIESEVDIEELRKIAKNQLFLYPGDMISYLLREEIKDKLKICKNCNARGENGLCPIIGGFVNPWQESCGVI